jgi:hypothetical protein
MLWQANSMMIQKASPAELMRDFQMFSQLERASVQAMKDLDKEEAAILDVSGVGLIAMFSITVLTVTVAEGRGREECRNNILHLRCQVRYFLSPLLTYYF